MAIQYRMIPCKFYVYSAVSMISDHKHYEPIEGNLMIAPRAGDYIYLDKDWAGIRVRSADPVVNEERLSVELDMTSWTHDEILRIGFKEVQ